MAKVAIVTGSNKGLGYGVIKLLLQQHPDWIVYLTSRDENRGLATVEQLKKDFNITAHFHRLDTDSLESINTFRDHLKANYPQGLHLLVNNAGIMPKIAINDDAGNVKFDDEAVQKTVVTGHFGYVNVLQELFPLMAKCSRVVNVSSGLAQNVYSKGTQKIQDRYHAIRTIEELNALANDFMAVPFAKLTEAGWVTVDPGLLFHDMFYLADMYPVGFTHLTIAILTTIYQAKADAESKGVLVNAVCPGRVLSDMNPTGILTPEEAAQYVIVAVNLPEDSSVKGHFIKQGVDYTNWWDVPNEGTGEVTTSS